MSAEVKGDWKADPASELSGQLRTRILDAARQCLEDIDIDKLRMAKVAEAAGCSRATIYRYFGSKEEIMEGIALLNYERINEEVDAEIRNIDDIRLKLATGLARSLAIAHSADASHRVSADLINRAMSSRAEGVSATTASRVSPVYRIALKKGWVRPGVTLEDAVDWIIQASTGLLSVGWPVIGSRTLGPDEQVKYLCRFLFYPIFYMDDLLD